MKNFLYIAFIVTVVVTTGCSSTKSSRIALDPGNSREAKLKHAIAARDKYFELLKEAGSVEDAVASKNQLDDVQKEIDQLQEVAPDTGEVEAPGHEFKSSKVIYGPLGLAFKGTEWILRKLWIIYEE